MRQVFKIKRFSFKQKTNDFITRFKELQGDPHYIALGMAIGLFVALTPTIPLRTSLAILLAFVFKASIPAAIIGTWFGNPLTVPFVYIGTYKIGMMALGHTSPDISMVKTLLDAMMGPMPFLDKGHLIMNFLKQEMYVFYAMQIGGFIVGIFPGIFCYMVTKKIVIRLETKKKALSIGPNVQDK